MAAVMTALILKYQCGRRANEARQRLRQPGYLQERAGVPELIETLNQRGDNYLAFS